MRAIAQLASGAFAIGAAFLLCGVILLVSKVRS